MGGMPPPAWGGIGVKMQAARGPPWASVGVLLSPRGVERVSGGGPACRWCGRGGPKRRATRGGWSAPARGSNSEGVHLRTDSHTAVGHGSSLSGKGWCGPWCPSLGVVCGSVRRHVSRCPSLAVRSTMMLPGGDCSWT